MIGDAKEEGELPVLQLHNWANSPLDIALLSKAALSPSRNKLLLLSRRHEALLVPLGSVSDDLSETSIVPRPLEPCSSTSTHEYNPQLVTTEEEVESDSQKSVGPSLQSTPAVSVNAVSSRTRASLIARQELAHVQEHTVSENLDSQSHTTPSTSFNFSPSPSSISPTHFASCKFTSSPSSTFGASPGLRFSSSWPVVSDIECFSWACCGEEYGANQTPGPFRELLLTGGKEGLIIHAFCNKSSVFDRTEVAASQSTEASPQLHPRGEQFNAGNHEDKRCGSWRNWGLGEFCKRQELWRRLEEQSNPDHEKSVESCRNNGQEFRCSDLNNVEGSKGVRLPKSLEGVVRDSFSPDVRGSGSEECRGLESFAVDASLEGNECEASLVYEKNHSWPLSAKVVSFRIAQGSGALSRLISVALKTKVESQVHENAPSGQKNDETTSSFSSSGWTRLKNGYFSTPRRREGRFEVSGIISSPSQSLVAIVFSTFPSFESRASPIVERDHSDASCEGFSDMRRDRTWKGSSDLRVITATVQSWGLKWAHGIDFEWARKEARVPIDQWADFKLSNDKFLGLTESGCVYFWAAITGNYIASIDAFQFCLGTFGSKRGISTELNVEIKCTFHDTSKQLPEREMTKNGEEVKADSGVARASCFKPERRHEYVQLVVTPDCSLIAIANDQGLVFLVSFDKYFFAYSQPPYTDFIPSGRYSNSRFQAMSSWEVAGLSIGGVSPIEGLSTHQLKTRLSSSGQKLGTTPRNVETKISSSEDCAIYSASSGSSGFTSRLSHEQKKFTDIVDSSPKLLRKVLLPPNSNDSFVGMALNPFSITRIAVNFKNTSKFTIVQSELRITGGPFDESMLGSRELFAVQERMIKQHRYEGEVLSFTSQGCLYLVTATALHVVLPPLALSSSKSGLAVDREVSRWPNGLGIKMFSSKWDGMLPLLTRPHVQQWQAEVQDRSLIFDGLEEIERLCGENGWSLQLLRLRRLQLALDYLQIDKIEQALEGLVDVGAAEAGMPRVLFAAVGLMLTPFGTDNELVLASRLLSIAAQFSTKLVRRHGLAGARLRSRNIIQTSMHFSSLKSLQGQSTTRFPNGVTELARFIEVIRTLQEHLQAKRKGRNRSFKMSRETSFASSSGSFKNRPIVEFPSESGSVDSNDSGNQNEHAKSSTSTTDCSYLPTPQGALVTTIGSVGAKTRWDQGALEEGKSKRSSVESADEMFARWENTSMDAESVVRDALIAGRIPAAVVQLHRMRSRAFMNSSPGSQPRIVDVFKDVQEISKGIIYELLCKGKMALAMAALRRLGEDIETALYQLAFGSVRRSLRKQTKKELLRHVRLGTLDSRFLEITTYLEGLYPYSSFWTTYAARQGQVTTDKPIIEPVTSDDEKQNLQMICTSKAGETFILECGDGDGVVLGSWNTSKNLEPMEDTGLGQHNTRPCYFLVATVWLHAWNQRTVNRIILDRLPGANSHIAWVSLLEYYVAHHNWPTVSDLLDNIPHTVLNCGMLHVLSDDISPFHTRSKLSLGKASQREIIIPKVNYLKINGLPLCSGMMLWMMEKKLAKSLIFLRLHWDGTTLLSLLAAAEVLFRPSLDKGRNAKCKELVLATSMVGKAFTPFKFHREAMQGVHELVVRHCLEISLPHLLERYLTFHSLGLNKTSAILLESHVGNCEWARWLLLSRLKGHEFDASFANVRTISKSNVSRGCKYKTVDDIAATGQGLIALTTLMYAPVPLQKCLSADYRMDGQEGQTWQCSLDNLREILQGYPTFLQTLESTLHGHDAWGFYAIRSTDPEEMSQDMSGYLQWRGTLSSSVAGDAHLLHILPRWVPKRVQRLLQLAIKGPGGVSQGTMNQGGNPSAGNPRNNDQEFGAELNEEGALQWEDRLQAVIKQELYALATEEIEPGVEHYLRCGRALAAFNTLLGSRAQFLETQLERPGKSSQPPESSNLLDSLKENEDFLIASIYSFVLSNFENSTIVAASSLFLELCGVSAQMLRVDIAALQRIAKYLRVKEQRDWASSTGTKQSQEGISSIVSLVKALTDEYGTNTIATVVNQSSIPKSNSNTGLTTALQMLEKATLMEYSPKSADETSGTWILNAAGNGDEFRDLQRFFSEQWSLVTAFCRGHELPLSTTYLVTLARDNDWVGFLAEAQAIGCPLDVLLNLASNEFTNPRLKCHILTVLKSLRTPAQTKTRPDSQENPSFVFDSTIPEELFGQLAECESEKYPGAKLLAKSNELQWPLLAVVASCFDDVKPISCLCIWLKITAARESFRKFPNNKTDEQLAAIVGSTIEAINVEVNYPLVVPFDRSNPKRQRCQSGGTAPLENNENFFHKDAVKARSSFRKAPSSENLGMKVAGDLATTEDSLAELVALLCEQQLFLPLLQAFELFTPKSSILPFIRFLQAFAQMRLTEASAELASFSALLKQETSKNSKSTPSWISRTAVAAAEAMLKACPSVYERHCLLQLVSAVDFCDSGTAALKFRRCFWKLQLVEPSLCVGKETVANGPNLGDEELLESLEASGLWDEGRMWAQQLDLKGQRTCSALHHVTETQANAMVAEWKELLWDVQTERAALWGHCQALFVRHSFPPLQAGTFFMKHADAVESDVSTLELQSILLLAFQWLSGSLTNSSPMYPIHLLHELEIRIWLLAVEAEVEMQNDPDQDSLDISTGRNSSSTSSMRPVDRTAETVALVDLHMRNMSLKSRTEHLSETKDISSSSSRRVHSSSPHKIRRKLKHSKYTSVTSDTHESASDTRLSDNQDGKLSRSNLGGNQKLKVLKGKMSSISSGEGSNDLDLLNQSEALGSSAKHQQDAGGIQRGIQSGNWEERIAEGEVERAVLALIEVGQVAAAKQLQQKLSPGHMPLELLLVEDAKKIANISEPDADESFMRDLLHPRVVEALSTANFVTTSLPGTPTQVLKTCVELCHEGCGRGLCQRIAAIAHISNVLGLQFMEAFEKHPVQLLQLLSFKGHEALEEATLLVTTHSLAAPAIARVLSETFYKGLAAAYRGGYSEMAESDDGPGPLLWRVSEFKQWAQLCPIESEIGHALMRLVISARDVPHPCEVDLLILAYQYYASSECLDGLDVLVGLTATRVDAYNAEADFASLTRLVIGLHSLPALRFILDILVESGQLELLLDKATRLDVVDADRASKCAVQGFHMGILSSLNHFNIFDHNALAMVYNQFNMTYEMAELLKTRAERGVAWWVKHPDPELSDELLETMHLFVEAAESYSTIDAGYSTSWCCAQASMISLQLRMPELTWLNLTETNARRLLVEQPRFAEALIVAEAYDLNQSAEWVPVLWNQMLQSSRIDQFLNEFVAVLPVPATMLMELARFYRAEVSARGYQMDFTKWLTPGAVPMELSRHLGKSMRTLLKQVSDIRVRLRLATIATGFSDVVDSCMQLLDRVPETAGPLILRKGHGGAYIPLM